jgi:hypothetical protein
VERAEGILEIDDTYPLYGLTCYDVVAQAILDRRVEGLKHPSLFPKGDRASFVERTGQSNLEGQWLWIATGKDCVAPGAYSPLKHQKIKWDIRRLSPSVRGEVKFGGARISVMDADSEREPFFPWIGLHGQAVIGAVEVVGHTKTRLTDTITFGQVKYLKQPAIAGTSYGLWRVNQEFIDAVELTDAPPEWIRGDNVSDVSTKTWAIAELFAKIVEVELAKGMMPHSVLPGVCSLFVTQGTATEDEMFLVLKKLASLWDGASILQKHRASIEELGIKVPSASD